MDKVGFLSANTANSAMARQENIANNLANINTPGFRATMVALRSTPLVATNSRGEAVLDSRTYTAETVPGFDNRPGTMQNTNRDLDVAVKSTGWFAVQRPNGTEGYTRGGSFDVNLQGQLVNAEGFPVLGDGGPIEVPQGAKVRISELGQVSAFSDDPQNPGFQEVGQLRLVDPNPKLMVRGDDGYFQMINGQPAEQSDTVRLATGYLEGSNVSPAESMVEMIASQRMFDMSMKALATAKEDDQRADGILRSN
jgi:flagellar basal-body rod protein FlgF